MAGKLILGVLGAALSVVPAMAEPPTKEEVTEAITQFQPRFEAPDGVSDVLIYDDIKRSAIVDTVLMACANRDPIDWELTLRARLFSDAMPSEHFSASKGVVLTMENWWRFRLAQFFQPPLVNQDELLSFPTMTAILGYQTLEGKQESFCGMIVTGNVELVEGTDFAPNQFSLAEFDALGMIPVPLTDEDRERDILRRWYEWSGESLLTLEVSSFWGVTSPWYAIKFSTMESPY